MKIKLTLVLLSAFTMFYVAQPSTASAQGTAFNYEGRLNDGGAPATGVYDLTFTLFTTSSGGSSAAGPLSRNAVGVTNGLFSVTLDYGSGVFNSTSYWLEISVRTNGSGSFVSLSPRQPVLPVPYAIYAEGASAAGLSGAIPTSSFSGTYGSAVTLNNAANSFSGNGAGLININASTLGGLAPASLWQLGGNAGTSAADYLGTSDNQPLTLKVNNIVALRIVPGASLPNVVGGLAGFHPTVIASGVSGAVVAGGNAPSGGVSGFGGGDFHAVFDNDGAIGGGFGNKAGSNDGDVTDNAFATVSGGVFNNATGYGSAVGGGDSNTSGGVRSVVAGGTGNVNLSDQAGIGGGAGNLIQNNSVNATISGGNSNVIQSNAPSSVIAGGTNNVIRGGSGAYAGVIGGGSDNLIWALTAYSTIGGGQNNQIQTGSSQDTISGGSGNLIQPLTHYATIGGGSGNQIGDNFLYSTIGGGGGNQIQYGAYASTIGGGSGNQVQTSSDHATVSGGSGNQIQPNAQFSAIGGGNQNSATGPSATIPGGLLNVAGANAFAAGTRAKAIHQGSFVWADAQGTDFASTANDQFNLRAQGGVRLNTDTSMYFGAQIRQMLNLWSTSYGIGVQNSNLYLRSDFGFSWFKGGSHSDSQYNAGAGGLEMMRLDSSGVLNVRGNVVANSVILTSDRNAKENLVAVQPADILDKVASLPISEWNFKANPAERHLGPMAQDFAVAFGLNGTDDKHIAVVDEGGVALAAIQGLNLKLSDQAAALKTKDSEIQELRQAVAELQRSVRAINRKTQEQP